MCANFSSEKETYWYLSETVTVCLQRMRIEALYPYYTVDYMYMYIRWRFNWKTAPLSRHRRRNGGGARGLKPPNLKVGGQSSHTYANFNQWCRLNSSQVPTCGFQSALLSSRQIVASRSPMAENVPKIKGLWIINFAFLAAGAPLHSPLYSTFRRLWSCLASVWGQRPQHMTTISLAAASRQSTLWPGQRHDTSHYTTTTVFEDKVLGDSAQGTAGVGPWVTEIPDTDRALPSGTATLNVKGIVAGQFELPNDSQLISAIYCISCSEVSSEEMSVEIDHFAVIRSYEQCSKFRFIIAETSQLQLPYKFKEREGSFNPHAQYGTIKLSLNSMMIGAVGPKDTELYFSALKFYKPIPGTLKVEFVFVVVCQSEVLIQVVYNHYSSGWIHTLWVDLSLFMQDVISRYSDFEEDRTRQEIQFESDAIELDLFHGQPKSVNDWKIISLTHPKVLFCIC